MNKTKFLAILALPAMFAACSQEEVITENANNVDLSNRKVIENVTLNFNTGIESRATLGDAAWNKYQLDPATDGVGAALVDIPTYQGAYPTAAQIAPQDARGIERFYLIQDYISTNYKYYVSGEQWKTDALMVEGNYVFYAPYNASHLTRTQIAASIKTTQNVKTGTEDLNALKEFYESGLPVFAGYKFLPAVGQEPVIDVKMQHLFAYPLFTLVNKVDFRTKEQLADENSKPVYKDIKIVKVEVKKGDASYFDVNYKFKHEKIKNELHGNHITLEDNEAWDATKHEDNVTTDLLDPATGVNKSKITANMGAGITIPAEGKISFHLVLPAEAYEAGIEIVAYDAEGNTYTIDSKEVRTGLTLNPGYRYPAQEYDTDENNSSVSVLKESKGSLLTYVLTQQNGRPSNIANNDDFIRYLKSLTVRYNTLTELEDEDVEEGTELAEDDFVLNEDAEIILNNELVDALIKYNYNRTEGGSVEFLSNVTIAQDVVVETASIENGIAELTIKSTSGAYNYAYTVFVPASDNGNITAAGTYVVSNGVIKVTTDKKPVNVIVSGSAKYEFGEANITSLNVVDKGVLTLAENIESLAKITINNGAILNIGENVLVAKMVNNYGTINNNGVMYGEANHNDITGIINVMSAKAITKAATGNGTIVNNVLGDVVAGANQTVTWTGTYKTSYADVEKNYASKGITEIYLDNTTMSKTTVAMLNAPFSGCNVTDIHFTSNVTLTIPEGGKFEGVTLWFAEGGNWIGSALNAPSFTNAKIAIASGKTLSVEYAKISGTKVAPINWKGTVVKNAVSSVDLK